MYVRSNHTKWEGKTMRYAVGKLIRFTPTSPKYSFKATVLGRRLCANEPTQCWGFNVCKSKEQWKVLIIEGNELWPMFTIHSFCVDDNKYFTELRRI